MFREISDYIAWWMLIPAVLIMLLQVPGCVNQYHRDEVKRIQVMTQHCQAQGKTYLQYPDKDTGQCI